MTCFAAFTPCIDCLFMISGVSRRPRELNFPGFKCANPSPSRHSALLGLSRTRNQRMARPIYYVIFQRCYCRNLLLVLQLLHLSRTTQCPLMHSISSSQYRIESNRNQLSVRCWSTRLNEISDVTGRCINRDRTRVCFQKVCLDTSTWIEIGRGNRISAGS